MSRGLWDVETRHPVAGFPRDCGRRVVFAVRRPGTVHGPQSPMTPGYTLQCHVVVFLFSQAKK